LPSSRQPSTQGKESLLVKKSDRHKEDTHYGKEKSWTVPVFSHVDRDDAFVGKHHAVAHEFAGVDDFLPFQ